jgi:hypothetical protein
MINNNIFRFLTQGRGPNYYERNYSNSYNKFGKRLYNVYRKRNDNLLNTGFEYKGKIFQKTISPIIYNDPVRKPIILKFEQVFYALIEKVKYIKIYYNFTEDKNADHINH